MRKLCVIFLMLIFVLPSLAVFASGTEYVYLQKYISSDDQAIIVRSNGESYLLELGVGAFKLSLHEGDNIIVNSPGLFAGISSHLILPDTGDTIKIWDSEYISGASNPMVIPQNPPTVTQNPVITGQTVAFAIGVKQYVANATRIDMDVAPYINSDGRVMLPLRALAVAVGVSDDNIVWNPNDKSVAIFKVDSTIIIVVGQKYYNKNGTIVDMDTSATISDGRLMLPLRAIASSMGLSVTWNPEERMVYIN